ncbi:MAG: hypothetical protein R3B06_04515 [Kofleriaceae bacterium]
MRQRRWFAGFLTWAVAVGALGLVCVTRSSRADDKSDLIRRIEDLLDDAGDALERLPGDSGDGPIGYADRYVQDARRAADDLARVAGDDASAKRLADDFDDVQDDWNEAAGYLRQLKAGARQHEPVAQRCVDAEKDLLERARAFESKNDPDGLAEIPRLAGAAQDSTKRALDDLYRHDDRMEDLADDADDFRGDGPWRDLASTVAQVTRTMFEKWRRDYDQTKRTCENLARGVDHPAVKEILGKLGTSAGGRKAIIEQLNRDARELASTLAGVSEDSSTGSVARAKRLLENIDRGVRTLAGTPTTDKEARLIVEKWPEGIRQLGEALDDLEDLKVHQHDMDPLPEKCQLKERELRDAIARNADDADGIDELPRLADQLAEPVRAGLAKADERMREEASDLDRAKAISASDGPWSDIRAAEQRDADETFRTYEDGYKKTKDACGDIVKGSGGKLVNEAVEALRRRAKDSGDSLDREVAAWVEAARRTYLLDCKAMESLWQAYCGTDFEPGEDHAADQADQTAAALQNDMQRAMAPLLRDLETLTPRVDALVKKRETRTRGEALRAAITKEAERLGRLQNRGTWRGNNNPLTQFAAQYGKDVHRSLWRSLGCQVPTSEDGYAEFPGGTHTKPDCIVAQSGRCEIWEFKPDSPAGRREGDIQIRDYQTSVPRYYVDLLRRKQEPDDRHGGRAFMDALKRYCYDKDDDEVLFSANVKYYKMCEKQYACEQ